MVAHWGYSPHRIITGYAAYTKPRHSDFGQSRFALVCFSWSLEVYWTPDFFAGFFVDIVFCFDFFFSLSDFLS